MNSIDSSAGERQAVRSLRSSNDGGGCADVVFVVFQARAVRGLPVTHLLALHLYYGRCGPLTKRAMFPQLHIFKMHRDGSRRWMKAATNLEDAKALVKVLAASSPGEYVITDLTGDKASIKFPPKRILFQIGYDEKELNARANLFRCVGHEIMSVPSNEAAKHALASIKNVDVFVVGYQAPERTRKEMVDWLKENFPKVKVVALVPFARRQLPRADYNIVLNDLDEWLALVATATG